MLTISKGDFIATCMHLYILLFYWYDILYKKLLFITGWFTWLEL